MTEYETFASGEAARMRLEKQFDEVMSKWKETILRVQGLEKGGARLQEERDGLAASVLMLQARVSKAREERDAALKRVEELTEALEKVTQLHDSRCSSTFPNHPDLKPYECDCGRDEARLALSGSVKP